MEYIVFAIPVFFILILIEWVVDYRRKTNYCQLNDAITSLNIGVLSRINQVFRLLIPFTIYVFSLDYLALWQPDNSLIIWLIAFILYDFCYYWHHRFGHEINLLWAAHVVHHSSEEYNLTTALRQTSGSFLGFVFYLPLAVLGVPLEIFIAVASLNLLYQFWVHTRHINNLGWYEMIFVTPSNHRVHHAINQVYIDKNYGGVFILWDRLFGTFQAELENEPCLYGVRKPLASWNPVWANLQVYRQLFLDAWHAQRLRDKLLIWFKPTGWRPQDVAERFPLAKFDPQTFSKYQTQISGKVSSYIIVQQLLLLLATFSYLFYLPEMTILQQVLMGSCIILTTLCFGYLLANEALLVKLELARFSVVVCLLAISFALSVTMFVGILVASVAFLLFAYWALPKSKVENTQITGSV